MRFIAIFFTLFFSVTATNLSVADTLGQIALVYQEVQTTMVKMQQAHENADKTQEARLQSRLESFIQRQKDLARVNLSATKAAIVEVRESSSTLTDQERATLKARLAQCRQKLYISQTAVKQIQVRYQQENKENRLLREKAKVAIAKSRQQARQDIAAHESDIAGYVKQITQTQKILEENIEKNKKDLALWKDSDPRKKGVAQNYADYAAKVASGDMRPHPYKSSINEIKKKIQDRKKMIADLERSVADGTYKDHPMHKTIGWLQAYINTLKQQDVKRRAAFKSGNYMNLKARISEMNSCRISCISCQVQLGETQGQLAKLEAVARQLEVFLDHEFVTSLPREKALWEKAISFCATAYDNIQEIRDKIGKYKTLVDLLQGGNPVKAADTLLEMTTGKGLISRIAQYQPFKKLLKFDALKQAILTGNLDKNALARQVADKNLPQELIDAYDTLVEFQNDPENMIKTNACEQLNSILDANPELKKLVDNYTVAQDYFENPEKMEAEFKSCIKEELIEQIRSTPEVQRLEAAVEEQEAKLKALEKNVREQLEDDGEKTLKEIMNSAMAEKLGTGVVVAYVSIESAKQSLEEKINQAVGISSIKQIKEEYKKIIDAADKIKKISSDMVLNPDNFAANLTRSVTGQFGEDIAKANVSASAFVKTVINDYQLTN